MAYKKEDERYVTTLSGMKLPASQARGIPTIVYMEDKAEKKENKKEDERYVTTLSGMKLPASQARGIPTIESVDITSNKKTVAKKPENKRVGSTTYYGNQQGSSKYTYENSNSMAQIKDMENRSNYDKMYGNESEKVRTVRRPQARPEQKVVYSAMMIPNIITIEKILRRQEEMLRTQAVKYSEIAEFKAVNKMMAEDRMEEEKRQKKEAKKQKRLSRKNKTFLGRLIAAFKKRKNKRKQQQLVEYTPSKQDDFFKGLRNYQRTPSNKQPNLERYGRERSSLRVRDYDDFDL